MYPDAWDKARDGLLGIMDDAFERCPDTPAFRQIVDERDTLDIRLVSYLYGEDTAHSSGAQQIAVSPENIEDLFKAAGRKLGEGLHRDWRTRHVEAAGTDPRRAKMELVALVTADLKRDLDKAAKAQTQTWMTLYGPRIKALPEKKRQEYDKVQDLASGGKPKSVFVDFLILRESATGPTIDIVDPHTPSFSDAADKLAGLAAYAEKHGTSYGRIESIIIDNGEICRLDLQDGGIRAKAQAVKTNSDVLRLFADHAVSAPTD